MNLTIISIHLNHYEGFKSTYKSISELYKKGTVFKWIIKDGGSNPEILIKIKHDLALLQKDTITFVSTTDKGVYDAMNEAIWGLSDNEMVLFLNCGDELSLEFINRINKEVIREFDFIYSDTLLKGSSKKFISPENIDLILSQYVYIITLLTFKI